MTAVATPTPPGSAGETAPVGVKPADLLGMEEAGLFELVDGRLSEKRMGLDSNLIAGEVAFHLKLYLRREPIGYVVPEQSFRCFPNDPEAVRRPDVAFISADRMPVSRPTGHVPFRPDLAVEVLSPNDDAEELERKLADYRAAAVPLVWVLVPAVRLVRVYPRGGPNLELFDGDTLRGDPVLPGFAVAVADLFPPRPNG